MGSSIRMKRLLIRSRFHIAGMSPGDVAAATSWTLSHSEAHSLIHTHVTAAPRFTCRVRGAASVMVKNPSQPENVSFLRQTRINRVPSSCWRLHRRTLPITRQGETRRVRRGPMDKASIAVWFWLGHESGASDRSGHLIDALGATLVAHQFADHTVRLEWRKWLRL